MMEHRDIAILVFNALNGAMVCLAIAIAGLGTYVWQTEIPEVNSVYERTVEAQGLVAAALGGSVSVLAWLGTFGVNNDKPKLLTAYMAILGMLVAPCITLAVTSTVYMNKWIEAADKDLERHMKNYLTDPRSAKVTDSVQLGYQCCGLDSLPASYLLKLPMSCCNPLLYHKTEGTPYCDKKFKFKDTCQGALTEQLEKHIVWLSSFVLLLAILFIALLVDLYFVRRPWGDSSGQNKDATADPAKILPKTQPRMS